MVSPGWASVSVFTPWERQAITWTLKREMEARRARSEEGASQNPGTQDWGQSSDSGSHWSVPSTPTFAHLKKKSLILKSNPFT